MPLPKPPSKINLDQTTTNVPSSPTFSPVPRYCGHMVHSKCKENFEETNEDAEGCVICRSTETRGEVLALEKILELTVNYLKNIPGFKYTD